MAGELTDEDKRRIHDAVAKAERQTGLEFCVIVGSRPQADAREEAERAFHKMGLEAKPSVLIMVVPGSRTLEIVTAPAIADRLPDADCDDVARLMTGIFTTGDIASGLQRGIEGLTERAGYDGDPDKRDSGTDDLPNVVDLDDPKFN